MASSTSWGENPFGIRTRSIATISSICLGVIPAPSSESRSCLVRSGAIRSYKVNGSSRRYVNHDPERVATASQSPRGRCVSWSSRRTRVWKGRLRVLRRSSAHLVRMPSSSAARLRTPSHTIIADVHQGRATRESRVRPSLRDTPKGGDTTCRSRRSGRRTQPHPARRTPAPPGLANAFHRRNERRACVASRVSVCSCSSTSYRRQTTARATLHYNMRLVSDACSTFFSHLGFALHPAPIAAPVRSPLETVEGDTFRSSPACTRWPRSPAALHCRPPC